MKLSPMFQNFAIVAAVVAGFLVLAIPAVPDLPFSYDEADYAYASQQGLVANWIDHPALNLVQFVRLGMTSGRDPKLRGDLSQTIRSFGDIHFYRHWHGPLFFQWLGFIGQWTKSEYISRLLCLLIPITGALVVYFGCLSLMPSSGLVAGLAAAFYGFGYAVVSSPELAPHQLFVVVSLLGLFCLAKLEASNDSKWWWWACFWTAISFDTIEVAFVNVAILLCFGWRCRGVLAKVRHLWIKSIGIFLATSLILWPAGILKLEPVRSYIFMAYLAIFRKGAWGNTTLAQTWLLRFLCEPAEWIYIVVAIALWWTVPNKRQKVAALPFLSYGILMLVVMFKVNATLPHYVLPYLCPLAVFAGITLGAFLQEMPLLRGRLIAAVLILMLWVGSYEFVRAHLPFETSRTLQIINSANSRPLDGKVLLAPQEDVSVLHYYFPHAKLVLYLNEEDKKRLLAQGQTYDVILGAEDKPLNIEYVSSP
jgi:hypothetical protein